MKMISFKSIVRNLFPPTIWKNFSFIKHNLFDLSKKRARGAFRRGVPVVTGLTPTSKHTVFDHPKAWYHPTILGPSTLGVLAVKPACLRQGIQIVERLELDDHMRYLLSYYTAGLERFGDAWRYADIVTALLAAAQLVQPQNYLEIGVRRGRSMAIVAATCPECQIVGFDLWKPNYAGLPNPGPDFVLAEMKKLGHTGRVELVSGNSHETLEVYFKEHPDTFFDLITVDGDHSEQGAEQDLRTVLPRLKVGGVIIFDDICHPSHPYLADVWQHVVGVDIRFATWEYTELGYGVAMAIRRDI